MSSDVCCSDEQRLLGLSHDNAADIRPTVTRRKWPGGSKQDCCSRSTSGVLQWATTGLVTNQWIRRKEEFTARDKEAVFLEVATPLARARYTVLDVANKATKTQYHFGDSGRVLRMAIGLPEAHSCMSM